MDLVVVARIKHLEKEPLAAVFYPCIFIQVCYNIVAYMKCPYRREENRADSTLCTIHVQSWGVCPQVQSLLRVPIPRNLLSIGCYARKSVLVGAFFL